MLETRMPVAYGIVVATGLFAAACLGAGYQVRTHGPAPAVWSVAGREVLRIRVAAGGIEPNDRVEKFEERLTEILSRAERPITIADVELQMSGKIGRITVCGDLLVTVLPEDAAANHTTVEQLARIWLSNLRKSVPLLSPRVNPSGA